MGAKSLNVLWGSLSLVVAAVFVVFVPSADKINAATGIQHFIARWFHSICWVFLAANFFLRALQNPRLLRPANLLSYAGGATYLIFLMTYLRLTAR